MFNYVFYIWHHPCLYCSCSRSHLRSRKWFLAYIFLYYLGNIFLSCLPRATFRAMVYVTIAYHSCLDANSPGRLFTVDHAQIKSLLAEKNITQSVYLYCSGLFWNL